MVNNVVEWVEGDVLARDDVCLRINRVDWCGSYVVGVARWCNAINDYGASRPVVLIGEEIVRFLSGDCPAAVVEALGPVQMGLLE